MNKTINLTDMEGPHANAEVLLRGNTDNPKRALLLFHGRGSNARNILGLTDTLSLENLLVLAPDASGHEWYPQRFTVSRSENEPHLTSALSVAGALIELCQEKYHIPPSAIILAGFSQGACLVADYIARNPQTYAGACIFSGGDIGSDEEIKTYSWEGSLAKTPVYIGCDEQDAHIPRERVEATIAVLKKADAEVTSRLYSNLGHAVHPDGIDFLRQILS